MHVNFLFHVECVRAHLIVVIVCHVIVRKKLYGLPFVHAVWNALYWCTVYFFSEFISTVF